MIATESGHLAEDSHGVLAVTLLLVEDISAGECHLSQLQIYVSMRGEGYKGSEKLTGK